MKKRYAGIGSRKTPQHVLLVMFSIAQSLAAKGYTLRSGAAQGADSAFEAGAVNGKGGREIWLPWAGFNGRKDSLLLPRPHHYEMAETIHPAWPYLKPGPQALHARNTGQILGEDLTTPVAFVICYTEDGAQTAREVTKSTGGTGTAIKLASVMDIPVVNLKRDDCIARLKELIVN